MSLLLALLLALQGTALRDRIEAALREAAPKEEQIGILIHSVQAGGPVYASGEREPLMLASNTKLLTTAAALARLGPDFKFRTGLGVAEGDLHVFGGGDPNISGRFHDDDPTAIFRGWASRLKEAGFARVGSIILHTGLFDQARMNPGWSSYDPWHWWSAPFGPLSLNDNCVDVRATPGAEGEPCRLALSPDTGYVTVINNTRTVAGKPERAFQFARKPGTNIITFSGEVIPRQQFPTYSIAIHDPTMFFGAVLRETLAKEGVVVNGRIEESARPAEEVKGYREVDHTESDLATTIAACNQPSQNFYAEMILRTLGWKLKGKGTLENGLAAVSEFLSAEAGLEHVDQKDGSGLTRENRASASDLVKLLLHMRNHKHGAVFRESLPWNGAPKGTLRNRLKAEELRGRLRAKTGHIGGVSTLSGYAESLAGDTYVFSILVNVPKGGSAGGADRLQDRICEILIRYKGD